MVRAIPPGRTQHAALEGCQAPGKKTSENRLSVSVDATVEAAVAGVPRDATPCWPTTSRLACHLRPRSGPASTARDSMNAGTGLWWPQGPAACRALPRDSGLRASAPPGCDGPGDHRAPAPSAASWPAGLETTAASRPCGGPPLRATRDSGCVGGTTTAARPQGRGQAQACLRVRGSMGMQIGGKALAGLAPPVYWRHHDPSALATRARAASARHLPGVRAVACTACVLCLHAALRATDGALHGVCVPGARRHRGVRALSCQCATAVDPSLRSGGGVWIPLGQVDCAVQVL